MRPQNGANFGPILDQFWTNWYNLPKSKEAYTVPVLPFVHSLNSISSAKTVVPPFRKLGYSIDHENRLISSRRPILNGKIGFHIMVPHIN